MPRKRTTGSIKTTSRKGNLRNAAVLTLSQVTKLVNLPVAQDVARHIHQITVALKPSVLQAPKENDLSAKELAEHIAGLLAVLDIAIPYLDGAEGLDSLCGRLRGAHAELDTIRASQYTTKLGSQTQFRDRIVQLKEEVYRTVLDLTLKLMIVTLAGNMRNRRQTRGALTRMHKLTTRTRRLTIRQQGALPSVLQASKGNGTSAEELGNHIAKLLNTPDVVLPHLGNTDELELIYNQLQDTYAELEEIQESRYVAKLASQTRIQEQIAQVKEDVSRTMMDLTLGVLAVTAALVSSMRDRQRTHDALMRTNQDVVRQ
ncbi:hypothetical protein RSOLAG22IIIB_10030 [Rhizoctonia solani]|uniref:Uncharacterized protein n=1 Tax=Rhizoctonia solani TaxID=456999 RepID=A0A0K6G121_9AGAM|nr:hypothetical protein RSOLAG22IIIB_10030 [Rhizoctonia solani]